MLASNAPDATTWLADASVVRDTRTERGSLIGLHTVLSNLPAATDGAIVVAWDMPFVTSALLSHLFRPGQDDAYAVIPNGPHGAEPMCAYYSRRCLPAIEAAMDAGDLRLSALIEQLANVRHVPMEQLSQLGDPARMFFNVNTARDLALADAMAAAEPRSG